MSDEPRRDPLAAEVAEHRELSATDRFMIEAINLHRRAVCTCHCGHCQEFWPCLVRRLDTRWDDAEIRCSVAEDEVRRLADALAASERRAEGYRVSLEEADQAINGEDTEYVIVRTAGIIREALAAPKQGGATYHRALSPLMQPWHANAAPGPAADAGAEPAP